MQMCTLFYAVLYSKILLWVYCGNIDECHRCVNYWQSFLPLLAGVLLNALGHSTKIHRNQHYMYCQLKAISSAIVCKRVCFGVITASKLFTALWDGSFFSEYLLS